MPAAAAAASCLALDAPLLPLLTPGGQEEGSAVFISNLQWWTTDAELEQLCAPYGRVRHCRSRPGRSTRQRACCFRACLLRITLQYLQYTHRPAQCKGSNDSQPLDALQVTGIRFIDDKACGKSRGMAIVEFAEADAASSCITGLNG